MILGFTGTQRGMTSRQRRVVIDLLEAFNPKSVRHGGCVGADAEFHDLCLQFGIGIIHVWPSNIIDKVANLCGGTTISTVIVHEPKPPLLRNMDIVAGADHVIACPSDAIEKLRSGTWATVRLTTRYDIKCTVIKPTDDPLPDER